MSLWWGLQEGPEEDSEDWVVEAELEAVEMFIVTRREERCYVREMRLGGWKSLTAVITGQALTCH